MRTSYSLALSLSVASCTLAACGGSSNNDNHHADAAKQTDAPRQIDGKSIDAPEGVDASPDGPPGTVSVAVDNNGSAVVGAVVYFQNADSSVVLDTETGSDGTASASMSAGGFVTLIEPVAGNDEQLLDTIAGVKPGDNLSFELGGGLQSTLTFDVTVPTDTSANVTGYELLSTCGSQIITPPAVAVIAAHRAGRNGRRPDTIVSGSNPPVSVSLACSGSGATFVADIVIASLDDQNNLIDSIYAPDTTITNGGALTITGSYVPVPSPTIAVTDAPNLVNAEAIMTLVTSHGQLYQVSDDVPANNGSGQATLAVPTTAGATSVAEVEYGFDSDFAQQVSFSWGSATPATTTFDFGQIELARYVTEPEFDVVNQQMDWRDNTTGASPSFVYAQISVFRDSTGQDWSWQLAAPGTEEGAIQFPTLPTDVLAFNPVDSDDVDLDANGSVLVTGGYDAVRANVFDIDVFQVPVPGTSGAMTVQSLGGDQSFVARHRDTHALRRARHRH